MPVIGEAVRLIDSVASPAECDDVLDQLNALQSNGIPSGVPFRSITFNISRSLCFSLELVACERVAGNKCLTGFGYFKAELKLNLRSAC